MSGAGPYAASGLWVANYILKGRVMTDKNVNMAEVLELTRSGRVMEATGLLQRGLSGAGAVPAGESSTVSPSLGDVGLRLPVSG